MFRVWRMAPWVRAPFLLLRRAGVAGAVIAASFASTRPAAAAAEIRRLRREVAELRRANEILKAASVFFAEAVRR